MVMSVRHLLPPTVPSSDTQVRLVFLGTSLNIKDGYSAAKPKRVPINQKMVECMSSFFYCFLDASKFSYRNDFFPLHK